MSESTAGGTSAPAVPPDVPPRDLAPPDVAARDRDGEHRPPMRRALAAGGPSWIELSVALTALVVSVASLFVARHQARVMDRQLAASVWPLVEYGTSNTRGDQPYITLGLRNMGVGPTRVRSLRLSYEGRPVRNAVGLLRACCTGGDTTRRGISTRMSRVVGRVLPAGENVNFIGFPPDSSQLDIYEAFDRERFKVQVRVCYCSVFDDCWLGGTDIEDPEPVKSCAAERAQPQYR